MSFRIFFILFIAFAFFAYAEDMPKIIPEGFVEGITVDLREPLYEDGILTTEKGGVISGPDLRIQALKIKYTRKVIDKQPSLTVEAEDQIIVEIGEYIFVGKSLFYDFQKKEGFIIDGRTQSGPWFFGGDKIEIRSDGSYLIYDGYVTTSENLLPEWQVNSSKVEILNNRFLNAENVQFKVFRYPILWVPSLKFNLDSIFDSPIRYRIKWGGSQGPRFGLTYEVFSWERWKTFVRFDYRLTRGPGGGIETYYRSLDHKTLFQSINYIAKDSSLLKPHEKARYRFEGIFNKEFQDNKTSVLLTWDKISDRDMPSSYYDRDFDFETSERTQLLVRRQEENWIGNLYTHVRINTFQTIKQELPTFDVNFRPTVLGSTGIVFQNYAAASYLDFKYSNFLPHVRDYSSTRFDYRPKLYRPFHAGPLTITPEIGSVFIAYGDSPEHDPKILAVGVFGGEIKTQLYKFHSNLKHVIEPYTAYTYYTSPSTAPFHHYIFDIEDGWYHLNKLTFGCKNFLYSKNDKGCIFRIFYADIFAHAFFNSHHIHPTIPKVYGRVVFFTFPTIRHTLESAWDLRHNQFSYFNIRLDWTVDADIAFSTEYRHRNSYYWRKADYDNFFIDAFYSEKVLRHSSLSDQRDTLLVSGFYRFHPNWAIEVASRQGWNRLRESGYSEYELDLLTTIQSAWHIRFSLQHTQNDNRVAVYVNVGLQRPAIDESVLTPTYYE